MVQFIATITAEQWKAIFAVGISVVQLLVTFLT
jgi:hypothetical protein